MSKRKYDVTISVLILGAVFLAFILLSGCASMGKWLKPTAAATTQFTNDPIVRTGVGLLPVPYVREIFEAVGFLATLVVGHYTGQQVGAAKAVKAGISTASADGPPPV